MTAVEYIKEKLLGNEYWYEDMTFDQIIDKAKEIDKEQKQSDYMRGWNDGYQNKVKNPFNDNPKSE